MKKLIVILISFFIIGCNTTVSSNNSSHTTSSYSNSSSIITSKSDTYFGLEIPFDRKWHNIVRKDQYLYSISNIHSMNCDCSDENDIELIYYYSGEHTGAHSHIQGVSFEIFRQRVNNKVYNDYQNPVDKIREYIQPNSYVIMQFGLRSDNYLYELNSIHHSEKIFNWFRDLILFSSELEKIGTKVIVFIDSEGRYSREYTDEDTRLFLEKYRELVSLSADNAALTLVGYPENNVDIYSVDDLIEIKQQEGKEIYSYIYNDCEIEGVCKSIGDNDITKVIFEKYIVGIRSDR